MATANTLATIDSFLKQYYGNVDVVASLYSRDFPLLSRIEKKPNVTGNPMKVPMLTSHGGGIAGDYTSAAASAKGVSGTAFFVEPGDFVGVVPLDTKTRMAMANDDGAFIDYVQSETDAKLAGMGLLHSAMLYGNGGGALGRRASLSSNTITLTNALDAVNFWPDMQIVASTGDGTGGSDALKAGFATVTGVDRDAGTVTVDSIAAITGNANNDYLFARGLFAGNVSQKSVMKGLGAWFTQTAATDTLWTVARSNRPELSGFRLPTALQVGNVVDRLRALSAHGFTTLQVRPRLATVNPKQWEKASIILQNQGYRPITVDSTETMAGYEKLSILGQAGQIELIGDPHCPLLITYLLDLSSIHLAHLCSQIVEFDKSPSGEMYVPATDRVGHEVRIISYPNLVSVAPWKNGTCPLPNI